MLRDKVRAVTESWARAGFLIRAKAGTGALGGADRFYDILEKLDFVDGNGVFRLDKKGKYPNIRIYGWSLVMPDTELFFKAMADRTRQRLLGVLSISELSVNELVEVLGQPQSTISRHLKVLREAGLLDDRRDGTAVMYSVRMPPQVVFDVVDKGGSAKGRNGTGGSPMIREWILDWVGKERLETATRNRLERVIRRRSEQGAEFFENVGARWDQLRIDAFGSVFHLEALAALLPACWTVADVGCGTGYMLGTLAERFNRVIAVDPASSMLKEARNRPELASVGNVEFREGSLAGLPIESSQLDLAVASLVLHHVTEPARALAELHRCLRDGGRLLIVEQQEHENEDFRDRMGDHWRGFSAEALGDWILKAGFTDVRVLQLSTAGPTDRGIGMVPGLFALTAECVKADGKRKADRRKSRPRKPKARQVDVAEVKARMKAVKAEEVGVESELDVHLL